MSKKNSHWAFKPAYLLPGIFLAASCGSTPDASEAPEPSPELEVTAEIPSVDELLQEQLAAMDEALADGSAEPADAEAEPGESLEPAESEGAASAATDGPASEVAEAEDEPTEEEVAEEVAELFLDPTQVHPVDMVDGIPMPMGFGSDPMGIGMDYPVPVADEEPVEVAMADDEQVDEPVEVALADDEQVDEPVEVALADDEQVNEPVEVALVDDEQVEEPVEVALADDEQIEEPVEVAMADEAQVEEPVEVAQADVSAVQEPVELEVAQAEAPVEPEASEGTDAVIELAAVAGPVAEPEGEPLDLFPTEEPAEDLVAEEPSIEPPTVEPAAEEVFEETPAFVEQPEEAQAADPTLDSAVAEAAPEQQPVDPNLLIWLESPTVALVLDTEHAEPGDLHAGRVVAATLADLPASWSFMADLAPRERMLLAPTLALDPSGGIARLVVDGPGLMESTRLGVAPPEYVDPALADLPGERRIDGSQFGPVAAEDLLVNDPGLGMIWWGTEVPFDHVGSKVDIQTPSVGRVRVVLESGDYVEGVLHAVGGDNYWVNGDLGRFAVKAKLVSHVERLPKPGLGVDIVGLQAGDLVRVKAKSGYVEGRLVSMKGEDVLIETADGMRVTLPGDDVQPLGDSDTRVVIP